MNSSILLSLGFFTLTLLSALPAQRGGGFSRSLPVMTALDADGDGKLSKAEVKAAPASLAKLDKDKDGKLAAEEMMPESNRRGGRGFGGANMMRMFPLIAALDDDGDGVISAEECADSAVALMSLDKDSSGELTNDELMPNFGGMGRGGRGGSSVELKQPHEVEFKDGTDKILDRETYENLSYKGTQVLIDTHLANLQFIKFHIQDAGGEKPVIYFINTKTHRAHMMFMRAVGIQRGGGEQMRGVLIYHPMLMSANGTAGRYTFEFEPFDAYAYDLIKVARDMLVEFAPILDGKLSYHPLPAAMKQYEADKAKYEKLELRVFLDSEQYADIAYLPLNIAEGYGRLRLMGLDERPSARDIVLYRSLPNEMPRVAGILTGVRQTPLSHVNLRAVQDGVPNAYVKGIAEDPEVKALVGKNIYYRAGADGYEIRAATTMEVDAHFAAMRPRLVQTPVLDLSVTKIRDLDDIGFEDAKSVGVKAANLAVLRELELGEGVVPKGYAVPFHFYNAFMTHNGMYERAKAMRAKPGFAEDAYKRSKALKQLRKAIKKADVPEWMVDALSKLQSRFPSDASLRCRSSTNNEDLPGFSGAGLYDSFTHQPKEGHLSKSIRQVFASLWNLRAYEEREFYRIDHFATMMGILVHPNYTKELANGVAVTDDIVYQTGKSKGRRYYVNTQIGEDLVTNPEAESIPEEMLLHPSRARLDLHIRSSNRVKGDDKILTADHLDELRESLRDIHRGFRWNYKSKPGQRYSMEVEFKITANGKLVIKQARPWVY